MSSSMLRLLNESPRFDISTGIGLMLGVTFGDGVMLINSLKQNITYYLDDHIYCCGSSTGADREALLEVATKIEETSRGRNNQGVTVAKVLELLAKQYEKVKNAELLLAGEDAAGVHLYTLKSYGQYSRVPFAAQGPGAEQAIAHLKQNWEPDMELKEVESLARAAARLGNVGRPDIDICIIFKRQRKSKLEFSASSDWSN